MARCSNILIGLFNIVMLVVVVTVGYHYYMHGTGSSKCLKAFESPLMIVFIALVVLCVLGLVGAFCEVTWAMCLYVFCMFLMILGLICFSAFALVVTNKGFGKMVSGRGFREYRLGDYSNWLQNYVMSSKNWNDIRTCMVDANICINLANSVERDAKDFYAQNLSPTQSGCCKPPTYCGYQYVNATFWVVPPNGPAVADEDCRTWSNNPVKLCYDCQSCKGGVLQNIKTEWRSVATFNGCILAILILIYMIGCCAYQNNEDRDYYRYRGYP